MTLTLANDSIDAWALCIAIIAALIAGLALWQNIVARKVAERANDIAMGQNKLTQQAVEASRDAVTKAEGANDIAEEANTIAHQALDYEKNRDKLNIEIKLELTRARVNLRGGKHSLVATIVNGSAFDVVIQKAILRLTDGKEVYNHCTPFNLVDANNLRLVQEQKFQHLPGDIKARASARIEFAGEGYDDNTVLNTADYKSDPNWKQIKCVSVQINNEWIDSKDNKAIEELKRHIANL